jgi:RNA polymerase sigma-70 factor (ECF subfamily)
MILLLKILKDMSTKTENLSIDKVLVNRIKSGDASAFDEMVSRYWDRIFARVMQLLKNRQDAEEVTQDAFVRALRGLEKFRGDSSFSTWLFQIATNLAHNKYWYWWRRKRDASISFDQNISDEGAATLIDIIPAEGRDPYDELLSSEFVDRVGECMPLLSLKHKEILTLRIADDMTYDEIANKLNISIGTVKSRIARARNSLRNKLGSNAQ